MPVRPFLCLHRVVLVAIAAVALLVAPLSTGVARAEDGYRYWGYYQLAEGTWQFAQTAPGSVVPVDGSVEGWRFAVSGMTSFRPPRTAPAFTEVCSKVRPVEGQKRVAVIVDPGTAEEAPQGTTPGALTATCVVAPPDASASQVLQLATTVRTDDTGMVCGVGGFPANGCAEAVSNATIPATEAPVTPQLADPAGNVESGTPGWVWGLVGGLIGALVAGGVVVSRKRRA